VVSNHFDTGTQVLRKGVNAHAVAD
jgi:hypothetical protein